MRKRETCPTPQLRTRYNCEEAGGYLCCGATRCFLHDDSQRGSRGLLRFQPQGFLRRCRRVASGALLRVRLKMKSWRDLWQQGLLPKITIAWPEVISAPPCRVPGTPMPWPTFGRVNRKSPVGGGNGASYVLSVGANVDEFGRYFDSPEATTQSLEFQFVLEEDEWRISALADGVVLSEAAFNEAFTSYRLYFFSTGYRELVADVRWFASRGEVSTKIVRALLAKPTFWLDQGRHNFCTPPKGPVLPSLLFR